MRKSPLGLLTLATIAALSGATVYAQEGKDATDVDVSKLPTSYSLPTAYWADQIGEADTSSTADHAIAAVTSTAAGRAFMAALATDSQALNTFDGSFYLNADNIDLGTLSVQRLIGSILNPDGTIRRDYLNGTYFISITGNANSATLAQTAGSAVTCSGGHALCDSYSWIWYVEGWSAWSACSGGTRTSTRAVSCVRFDNMQTVSDSKCSGTKPATSKIQACATYSWDAGTWGQWGTCTGSSQTRTRAVTCRNDLTTEAVDDSFCSGTSKPSTQQSQYCGTYSWTTTAWSGWSVCNGGSQSRLRTVTCQRDDTGATVADSYCTSSKPSTYDEQACGSFYWHTTSWSGWSTCSGGSQTATRTVTCRNADNNNAIVSDSLCSGAGSKPASTTSQACGTYFWYAAPWSGWSTCSGGSQTATRTVNCRNADNNNAIVSDSLCSGAGSKPTTSKSQSCGTYFWYAGNWSGWSTCNGGSQTATRTVNCRNADNNNAIVADSLCSGAGSKPSTSKSQSCGSYFWYTGSWSGWSTCSGAQQSQTRTVQCRNSADGNAVVSDSLCSGSKPSATNTRECHDYWWHPTAWSAWSACNGGSRTRTRTLRCRDAADGDRQVSLSLCPAPAPATSQTESCWTGTWRVYTTGLPSGSWTYRGAGTLSNPAANSSCGIADKDTYYSVVVLGQGANGGYLIGCR